MTRAKHPRTLLLLVVTVAVAFIAAVAVASLSPRDAISQTASSTGPQKMAVPAYFYPSPSYTEWPQMNAAGVGKEGGTVAIAVMNPNSGPGTRQNSDYVRAVNEAKAAGIKVYGYVYTSYGSRSWGGTRGVKADIDRYYSWYGIDGIFLDEAEYRDCSDATYYKNIFNHVRSKDSANSTVLAGEGPTGRKNHVIQNPGTQTQECYMQSADLVINFESTYDAYKSSYSAPSWVQAKKDDGTYKYAPSRFWHLVHTTPEESKMQEVIDLSKQRHAGYMYVTPDVMSNPWDTLPKDPYWSQESTNLASQ